MKKIIGLFATAIVISCSKPAENVPEATKLGGNITYTIDGVTTRIEDGVSTGIFDNGTKIGDISNSNVTTRIGNGSAKLFTVGTPITDMWIVVQINGETWSRIASGNIKTITSYDGTTVKGTFSGQVSRNVAGNYVYKNISGTFETNDIVKL